MYGHKVSHAKNRTNRIFAPNLHLAKVMMKGVTARVKLCTKCLRVLKKSTKKALTPKVQTATATA
jgi:large subunit ribosomal protein L28